MTITQLNYFLLTAENHSLTKTAELCYVSQPAVSAAIRDLEKEYDLKLFRHEKRQLVLTEEGVLFYQHVRLLMNQFQGFNQAIKNRQKEIPPCSLAITTNLAPLWLPWIYTNIPTYMPALRIQPTEDRVSNIFTLLGNGLIDAACIAYDFEGTKHDDLRIMKIGTLEIDFFASKKLFKSVRKEIEPNDISNVPVALYGRNTTLNNFIYQLFDDAGTKPNILCEMTQLKTIEEITRQGISGSFLPSYMKRDMPKIGQWKLKGVNPTPVHLVWKNDTPQVSMLKDLLQKADSYHTSNHL